MFLGLPHGASQDIVAELRGQVKWIVDLAADFRLHDPDLYPQWYGEAHTAPELLGELVYGLPELFRAQIAGATGVASAGCYPTAATLALAPLVRAGLIEPRHRSWTRPAACRVPGAAPSRPLLLHGGRGLQRLRLLTHRHTPEIEQRWARPPGWMPAGCRCCSPRTSLP